MAIETKPENYHVLWQKNLSLDDGVKWWFTAGQYVNIVDGTIFYSLVYDTNDKMQNLVAALDASTGNLKSSRTGFEPHFAEVVFGQGKLLVKASYGEEAQLYVLDPISGETIYTKPIPYYTWAILPYELNTYFKFSCKDVASFSMSTRKVNWVTKLVPGSKPDNMACDDPAITPEYIVTKLQNGIRVNHRSTGKHAFLLELPIDIHRGNSYFTYMAVMAKLTMCIHYSPMIQTTIVHYMRLI